MDRSGCVGGSNPSFPSWPRSSMAEHLIVDQEAEGSIPSGVACVLLVVATGRGHVKKINRSTGSTPVRTTVSRTLWGSCTVGGIECSTSLQLASAGEGIGIQQGSSPSSVIKLSPVRGRRIQTHSPKPGEVEGVPKTPMG